MRQPSTNEFTQFPAITYAITDDAADVIDMDNNMLSQDVVSWEVAYPTEAK